MPASNIALAPAILHLIWQVRPAGRPLRLVDVGPGWGKYAVLIREAVDPDADLTGVEAWPPYVTRHRLEHLYNRVLIADILTALDPANPTGRAVASELDRADIVLMVDVIEHLPKAPALQLLHRIPGHIVICTPDQFFENPADLPPPEAHISHWTPEDFHATGRVDHLEIVLGGVLTRLRPRGDPAK